MGCENDAWAAGFIDGEGYLFLNPTDKGINWSPRIQVAQIRLKPLIALKNLYGGNIIVLSKRKNRRQAYRWDLQGSLQVKFALKKLHPHMLVKQKEAELLLNYISLMNKKGVRLNNSQRAKRQKIFSRLKEVRRGC